MTDTLHHLRERAGARLRELRDDLRRERPCTYPMAAALVMGILLLLPTHLFSQNAPHFNGMRRYGPEWAWGAFTVAVAVAQAAMYLLGRYWHRIVAESLACFAWVVIACLLGEHTRHHWHGLPLAPALYVYGLFAAGCAWAVIFLFARYASVDWLAAYRRWQVRNKESAATGRRPRTKEERPRSHSGH